MSYYSSIVKCRFISASISADYDDEYFNNRNHRSFEKAKSSYIAGILYHFIAAFNCNRSSINFVSPS